jgi:hypothetical protein
MCHSHFANSKRNSQHTAVNWQNHIGITTSQLGIDEITAEKQSQHWESAYSQLNSNLTAVNSHINSQITAATD